MNLVAVLLTDGQQGSMTGRRSLLLDSVITGDIPGINAWIIGRLESTGPCVALAQHAIAVGPIDQLASPGRHAAVPVSKVGLAALQELVREFEVEVVADTLRIDEQRTAVGAMPGVRWTEDGLVGSPGRTVATSTSSAR